MANRFPFRTAIAGLTALALTAPVVAPVNTTTLASAVAQVREDLSAENKLVFEKRPGSALTENPNRVDFGKEGTFTVRVPNAEGGSVQFFLDNVAAGAPVEVVGEHASAKLTPTSFTSDSFKHTVTARYVDKNGFNTRADVETTFSTPNAVPKELRSQNQTDEEMKAGRYSFTINGRTRSDNEPLELEQGQEFTLNGSNRFTSSWGSFTNVYEIGLNPPAGAEFVDGTRKDRRATVAYQGANADGTGIRQHPDADGNWGIGSNPKVNPGFISYRPEDFKMFAQTAEVEGTFTAPQTPGIYYPQFAIFKYTGLTGGNKTRYLHRMDTAVFRVLPPALPERNLRTAVSVELVADQKLQATVDGTLTATVSPDASGTVTFIHPGSNSEPDTVLGTAGVVDGEAKLHPVNLKTMGEQDIKLTFTPAPGTNWTASEGAGTVFVDHAPAKTTNLTLTIPGEAVQGVQFDASATVDEKVDGTIQFYSVETDEQGNKTDVKYGDPIEVNANNNWTATVHPKLFKLGQQTAKAVFTPKDGNAYAKSEKTQDIYIKQPATKLKLTADEGKKVGEDVNITAAIDPAVGGTIVFTDGDTELATESVAAGTAEVTITKSFNTSGSHALKAIFTPTDNVIYPTAEDTTSLVIGDRNKIDTTLDLTADKSELTVGEAAIVTAKIPEGVEGRVMFDDGTGVQAFAPVDKATGEAKFTYVPRTDGAKTVQAEFVPINASAATHNGTAKSVDITVKPASTVKQDTNLVLTGPNTVTEGDSIVLTAFVNPRGAAGTIQFSDGTTPIGDPVEVRNGKATITVPQATLGNHQFSASYNPAGAFNATQPATHSVDVNAAPAPVTHTVTSTATAVTTAPTTVTQPTTVTNVTTETAVPKTVTTTVTQPTTINNSTTVTSKETVTSSTTTTTTVASPTTITDSTTVTTDKPTTVTSVTTTTERPAPVITTTTKTESVDKPTTVTKSTTVEKPTTVTKSTTVEKPTTVTKSTTVEKPTTVTTTSTKAGEAPAPVTVTTTVKPGSDAPAVPAAPAVDSSKAVDTTNGREVTLTASVTPGTKGEVVFETEDGTVIGKAPIAKDGTAKLKHTFNTPGTYKIRSYVQSPDGVKGEKSAAFNITVAERPSLSTGSTVGSSEDSSSTPNAKIGLAVGGTLLAFLLGAVTVGLLGNPAVKALFARFGIRY
ncbi:Ig-like domain-containing protein [Corynebacterium urinipleomorphum]|uniref:Ig-like domain-containing protein n=1 Tax=Corynebacterium urinipleomorphum TaxID=1852380 RepID=UPI000B3629FD|nr:Ig-like domain-containing protein [Corynebacterium urinipleomorphum]